MLNAASLVTLNQAVSALRAHKETALADALAALVTEQLASRAAISKAAKAKGKSGKTGRPARTYSLVVEPGYVQSVQGTKAAHAALEAELATHGLAHEAPKAHSLAVMIARNGHWTRLLETDNGVVTITVK